MAVGLKININVSKVMMNKHATSPFFSMRNETLEQVEESIWDRWSVLISSTRKKSVAE